MGKPLGPRRTRHELGGRNTKLTFQLNNTSGPMIDAVIGAVTKTDARTCILHRTTQRSEIDTHSVRTKANDL